MIWLFMGLIFAFKSIDSQKKTIENNYPEKDLFMDYDKE